MTKGQFEDCFKNYYKQLVVFAHKMVQRQDIAEDIVQQVFMSIWEHLEDVDVEKGILAYLYQSTRNRCLNHFRSAYHSTTVHVEEHSIQQEAAPGTGVETKELFAQIQAAIQELPEKCREVFLLSREQALTYREIAATLNLSVKTVENQMGKALKHLHSRLGPGLTIILWLFWGGA